MKKVPCILSKKRRESGNPAPSKFMEDIERLWKIFIHYAKIAYIADNVHPKGFIIRKPMNQRQRNFSTS